MAKYTEQDYINKIEQLEFELETTRQQYAYECGCNVELVEIQKENENLKQELVDLKANANKVAIEKLEEAKHGIGEIDIRDDYTEAYWWQLERLIDELIAELKRGGVEMNKVNENDFESDEEEQFYLNKLREQAKEEDAMEEMRYVFFLEEQCVKKDQRIAELEKQLATAINVEHIMRLMSEKAGIREHGEDYRSLNDLFKILLEAEKDLKELK